MVSLQNQRIFIVGGGIAGLYCALKLVTQYSIDPSNITIVEKSYRCGRRVHTLERDGIVYECGAGRFQKEHKLLINLIKRYGLESQMIPLSERHQDRRVMKDKIIIPNNFDVYFDKLLKIDRHGLREELIRKTLYDVAIEYFGIETADILCSAHGYDDEFKTINAFDGLELLEKGFHKKYYVLKGGLEQIITKIVEELQDFGVNMRLHTKCIDWTDHFKVNLCNINGECETVQADKIILAMDKAGLDSLPGLDSIKHLLDSVEITPLTRIYAKFPINIDTGLAWFHGIPKTTTNLPIRMFIPIDESNGFCMISYSDSHFASAWQESFLTGDLDELLMKYIRQLFPEKDIPEPEWIHKLHWAHGCHMWKPYVYSHEVSQQILNPLDDIYICGESYSHYQGWIEGSLETSEKVLDILTNSKDNRYKTFTKYEVETSQSLTIIGGKVYDLNKNNWIQKHPGGDIIKKAIGKDATSMFQYIGHPQYAKQILLELYVGELRS